MLPIRGSVFARSGSRVLLGLALVGSLVGCGAGPLVVGGSLQKGDRMKFLYSQLGSDRQGVIECTVKPDGEIVACRHLAVVLQED